MSYHSKLINLQDQNLFDIPIQESQQFNQGNNQSYIQEIDLLQETDYELKQTGGDNEVDLLQETDYELNQEGGDYNKDLYSSQNQENYDPQLFNSISKIDDGMNEQNTPIHQQEGGFNTNIEGMEYEELTDGHNQTEEIDISGNFDNPEEDFVNVDNDNYDKQKEELLEPPEWIHPELTIEEDFELINQMNDDDINAKVNIFIDNYNSEEYQIYQKYFQAFYSSSNQKYSIRKDNKGNIYLVKKEHKKHKDHKDQDEPQQKGKKIKENIYDIIEDKDFEKDYMIKLTPPEYLDVKEEIKKINKQLNVLSGDIKLLQSELIELGQDITKDNIKHFEKLRDKFYKLINKKQIYSRYYNEVNGFLESDNTKLIYVKEIISDVNENDIKIFKFKSNAVQAPESIVDNITQIINNNINNYTNLINFSLEKETKDTKDTKDKEIKEYNSIIKKFINEKKESETKIQKELSSLLVFSKPKVDFIIKRLPKIDIKTDIF